MPHGAPDFGMYAPKITVGSLADMGELAARLNSIVTLDRRGDVVFMDDFESPVAQWELASNGVLGVTRLYPSEAFMGSQCILLQTAASTDKYAEAVRRFHSTPNQRYGIEARVRGLTIKAYYRIQLAVYAKPRLYWAEWQYDADADELSIWKSTGAYEVVATGIAAVSSYDEWWPMKLVIDSSTLKYVRGLFLGVEYDLSDEALEDTPNDTPPCLQPQLKVVTQADVAAAGYWDNFILTQNEP